MANRRSVIKRRKSKNKTKRINQRGGLGEVELLDTLDNEGINFPHIDRVISVAFCSHLPLLATSNLNKKTKLWLISCDSSSYMTCISTLNEYTSFGHSSYVRSLAFHPTEKILATGSDDNTVKLWRISPPKQYRPNRFTSCFRRSRVGRSGQDNWKVRCVSTLEYTRIVQVALAFHNNLPLLATGSYDNTVRLWMISIDSNSAIRVDEQLTINKSVIIGHVHTVAFHPTAPLLIGGGSEGIIKLWNIMSNDNDSPELSSECSSLSCFRNSRVRQSRWTANEVASLDNEHAILCVAFHPTEPIFATGSSIFGIINLWRLSSNNSSATRVATIKGHNFHVNSLTFHPTEPLMVTGSADETVKFWWLSPDYSSASIVSTLNIEEMSPTLGGVNSVAFHPTLLILATGHNDSTTKLWNCDPLITKVIKMLKKMRVLHKSATMTKLLVRKLVSKPGQELVYHSRFIPPKILNRIKSSISHRDIGNAFTREQYLTLNAKLDLPLPRNTRVKMIGNDPVADNPVVDKSVEDENDSSTSED